MRAYLISRLLEVKALFLDGVRRSRGVNATTFFVVFSLHEMFYNIHNISEQKINIRNKKNIKNTLVFSLVFYSAVNIMIGTLFVFRQNCAMFMAT